MAMVRQEYIKPPRTIGKVRGLSSKAIFRFMSKSEKIPPERISDSDNCDSDSDSYSEQEWYHPLDVSDWERNRALLLCYPEWRSRLSEMAVLSEKWKVLTEAWSTIERLYDEDYLKYGDRAYSRGECDRYIRSLTNFYPF
jgi:hypothetical protein